MPADVLIVNLVVLGVVLSADLGTRTITRLRIMRPLIVAAVAVVIFVRNPQTSGTGLTLELVGLVSGLILGAIGVRLLMVINTEERTTVAGAPYAAFWIVVIGARLLFTYGAEHWYTEPLGRWLITNHVTVDGLTDALVLFAIGMVLARALRFARALSVAPGPQAAQPAL